jgi:AcrR family transcriptional regulator
MTATERALLRIREAMAEGHLTTRDLAATLGCSQARIAKYFRTRSLRLEDVAALCKAVNLSLIDAVRDRTLAHCTDLTPLEEKILEQVRRLPPESLWAHALLLGIEIEHPKGLTFERKSRRRRRTIIKPTVDVAPDTAADAPATRNTA